MKLNLGCGDNKIDGYENLDRKLGSEVFPLIAYPENSIDEIRASHILEHFERRKTADVLKDWVYRLKPNGILKIAVPDFGKIAESYNKRENMDYAGYICGGQIDENDFHKNIFNEAELRNAMEIAGLSDIKRWESDNGDCASYPISLNLQGTKTEFTRVEGEIGFLDVPCQLELKKIFMQAKNIYSQNGEDGILEALFEKIGTENKWCLEVGAADGIMFSNTRQFVEKGWNAVLIESNGLAFERLAENCKAYPNTRILNLEINTKQNNLDSILESCHAPKDIDLLCIDIDGQDWHIWNQMLKYKPRVVVIEYNPNTNLEFIPLIGGEGQAGKTAVYRLAGSKLYHNFICTKYNVIAIRDDLAGAIAGQTEGVSKKQDEQAIIKIAAVMSMPRLAFTDNLYSAVRSLIPLGITLEKGTGVFWGQILTRLMAKHLNDGTEYIIAIDYDTYFTKNQVIRLIQLMQENPNADVILPLQIKRECDSPLIGKFDEQKRPLIKIPIEEFKTELLPISSGHFGLTIFRVSALKKLKKPWFMPVPDKDLGWDDGRLDEDIYFWKNFSESGLQAYLAPKIGLAHLQLMATVPGKLENGFKPEHYYITELEKSGLPKWCEPEVEYLK